jgi:hypothetical protein
MLIVCRRVGTVIHSINTGHDVGLRSG